MPNNIQVPDFIGQLQNTLAGASRGVLALGQHKLAKKKQDEADAKTAGLLADERKFKLDTAENLAQSKRDLEADRQKFNIGERKQASADAQSLADSERQKDEAYALKRDELSADTKRKDRLANEESALRIGLMNMSNKGLEELSDAAGVSMARLDEFRDDDGHFTREGRGKFVDLIMKTGTEKLVHNEQKRGHIVKKILAFEQSLRNSDIVDGKMMAKRRMSVQATYQDPGVKKILVDRLGEKQAALVLQGITMEMDQQPALVDDKTGKITRPGMLKNEQVLEMIEKSRGGGGFFGTTKHEDQYKMYEVLAGHLSQKGDLEPGNQNMLTKEMIFIRQNLEDLKQMNEEAIPLRKMFGVRNATLENDYYAAMSGAVKDGGATAALKAGSSTTGGVGDDTFVVEGEGKATTAEQVAAALAAKKVKAKPRDPNAPYEQDIELTAERSLQSAEVAGRGKVLDIDTGREMNRFGGFPEGNISAPELRRITGLRDSKRAVERELNEVIKVIEQPYKMVKVPPGESRAVGDMPSAHDSRPLMKRVRLSEKEVKRNVARFRELKKERDAIQAKIEAGAPTGTPRTLHPKFDPAAPPAPDRNFRGEPL